MRKAINLIVINEEQKLFLCKKKDAWILPGGKPENQESGYNCIYRELKEELSISLKQIIVYSYYGSFIGKTPYSKEDLEAKVYFGGIIGKIKPNNEISEAKYIKDFENYKISEITSKIVSSLRKDKYL